MRCIIVEDELMAMKSLERLVSKVADLELIGQFENGKLALDFLEKNQVDLIFLDIEMPEMSGLEMLDSLSDPPQVIFTTGNVEYAYDAFEHDITDFLKKPVTEDRFLKSVEKSRERKLLLNSIKQASIDREIYFRVDGRHVRVPYEEILYFENVGDYMKVFTSSSMHVIYASVKQIVSALDKPEFLKVHRSFVINLAKISEVGDNSVIINKKTIPVSRAHKPILLSSLNLLT